MQIHFHQELIDEGIESSFDIMKDKGGINTVCVLTNCDHLDTKQETSYGALTRNPKRDYLEVDGFYYEPHAEYYKGTKIRPEKTRSPEFAGRDYFGETVDAAKNRGMDYYAFYLHRFPSANKYPDCYQVDILGHWVPPMYCYNNPDVRNLYLGMTEDLIRNYEIDGLFLDLVDHHIQWGYGTLTDEIAVGLGISTLEKAGMGLACFCKHCTAIAESEGIDVRSVKRALLKAVQSHHIPSRVESLTTADDVFRFLLDVPEYLEWMIVKARTLADLHAQIYSLAKSLDRKVKIGLDLYSVSDSWKYCVDWKQMQESCDWIKPMFYSGTFPGSLYTPDRVGNEVAKAIQEVDGKVPIVSGIVATSGVDQQYVKDAIRQSIDRGADGVMISWDYALIPVSNLEAARITLKELGIVG
jgi:hypothetical protein